MAQRSDSRVDIDAIDLDEALRFVEFKLPPPKELTDSDMRAMQKSSMTRIWESSKDLVVSSDVTAGPLQESRSQDLWMLLLVRMLTRSSPGKVEEEEPVEEKEELMEVDNLPRHERVRHILFDYIMSNFPAREGLALTWMNEEWYNDRLRRADDPDWVSSHLQTPATLFLTSSTAAELFDLDAKARVSVRAYD